MIQIENLGKTYSSKNGPIVALSDINLTINDGDVFGIIGLSGAGKSTLVRCINLLEKPTKGSVIIDGEDLTKVSKKRLLQIRSNIGMIFQNFNLLDQRNVFDNVKFPLELIRAKKDFAEARVKELLNIVGLSDRAKSYPSQLSGGQKQRVAIARALATNPKYLLCDEATSALDPTTTTAILELLKQINKTMGVTIIVITHEMKVVESICNRVAVIDKSEIVESGFVSSVFADPKSEIAKELILPDLIRALKNEDGVAKFRLIFDGNSSDTPVVSGLAKEYGIMVNILYADTKTIDGKPFGHMVITMPKDEPTIEKVNEYLTRHNVKFTEEQ